ncbi:MAG: thioredoxin-disulfide reductase [Candidatus Portnoybacteria bacterium CG23_combo_of_CG06-09_8_20_14_all_37_13]|uniref:Thioredoxin-disulfide reductase n=1 Tax=Candidatus Portnoybacteria bacterium CG23_combo_of_CG06-09_8_20_14_all_37_13 TaxID=1974819 RepID=A0A2G9YFI3_9BACT|nr:MAG: thioredoxin-disulfide reductase [Candidatus Portnoybacteria bacterium CG23_combo_of_CG06-09_8_20_14_all_37_13]
MKDLIIIGAGPAGLTAGIYAKRYNLDFLVIGQTPGGTAIEAWQIENYPGFKSIAGLDLMQKFQEQLGQKIIQENIEKITKDFLVYTDKNQYQGKTLILAMGSKNRKLGLENEEKFLGRGISYCVTCDGPLFKDKIVAVVGGGNAALTGALELADIAKKVYLIHRRDEFRADPIWQEKIKQNKKIEIIFNTRVVQVKGDKILEKIILDSSRELEVSGLFIEIGTTPSSGLAQDLAITLENDFIVVDKNQATNIPGVFAAGDITNNPLKQIISACGQGAVASFSAFQYVYAKHKN